MTQPHCPNCSAILPSSDVAAGRCGTCGATLADADRTVDSGGARSPGPDADAPASEDSDSPGNVERTIEATARPAKSAGGAAKSAAGSAGGSAPMQKPSLVGQEIGGCRVIELVGTGAMGAVYAATQIQLDRKVAVKIIHPELWQNERVLKRFQQEAKAVGKLSSPHVVQIHQVGFENGINYLVMEFVAGGNLRTYAARQPESRITSTEAVKFMRQCVLGLKEAESKGILHRDIKPDNLLLDRNGDVKIADFGLAKTLGDRLDLTASSDLMGTPLYMSPEQCRGDALDFRTDMYSLGASFYYLLTAQPPVEGKTIFEVLQTKTKLLCLSPAAALPELSGAGPASRVIEKMTALNADDRYASYDALLADLDKVEKGEKVSGVKRRAPEREKSKASAVIAGVVFLAVAAAGVWFVDPMGWRTPPVVVVDDTADVARKQQEQEDAQRREAEALRLKQEEEARRLQEAERLRKKQQDEARRLRGTQFDLWQVEFDKMLKRLVVDGPTESVLSEANDLNAAMPEDGDDTLKQRMRKLVDDIGEGRGIHQSLRDVVPPAKIELPFDDVKQHVVRVRANLTSIKNPGPELKEWLDGREAELLDKPDLRTRARTSLTEHWIECRTQDLRRVETELQEHHYRDALKKLIEGKANLCTVFPDLREPLDLEIVDAAVQARLADLESRVQERKLLAEIAAAQQRIDALHTLADWAPAERDVGATISELRKRSEALAERYPPAAEGLTKVIAGLTAAAGRMGMFATGLAVALTDLARGKRADARERLAKLGKVPGAVDEVGRVVKVTVALDRAIEELLERNDAVKAGEQFRTARDELSLLATLGTPAADASARVDLWQARLRALSDATAKMVAVPPPYDVELSDGTQTKVGAFYIDQFEASRGDFRNFLDAAKKPNSDAAKAFASPNDRDRALDKLGSLQDLVTNHQPVDGLTYYEAAAYVRWRHKSLPHMAEWLRVAHGAKGKTTKFPWGDSWEDNDPKARNPKRFLARVDVGGLSAHFTDPPIHHLAGNVAEWLEQAAGETRNGLLVGGSCMDDTDLQYRFASGERQAKFGLNESVKGNGCRGVLRVREFFADLLGD